MLPPGAPAAGLGPARAAAAGRDGDAPLDGARRPGPLRDGSGLRDRLFREPAHGERRGPRARRPLRRAAGRRAARARPVDEPASRAVPCGRGFPRDVRRRRFRRSAVLAARRRGRRPPGDDGTRPPGRAAAPRARVSRGRPGGRGGAMMNRALLLVCLVPLLARAEPPAPLAGRVTDAAGRPVAGAFVTARHLELARETTVYADGDGRWTTPPLEPGRYHLRARRPGFRDRTEVVELAGATPGNKVLVLERETDPRELAWQLPANRWLALAVAHLPADAARAVITEWEVGGTGSMQHDLTVHPDGRVYSVDTTQDKLYRLDPGTGERRTFDVPRGDSPLGGVFTVLQPIPANADAHVAPHSLQVAPDGSIWITLCLGNKIARFDPRTELFEIFLQDVGLYPHTLRFDARGRAWYTLAVSNQVAMID